MKMIRIAGALSLALLLALPAAVSAQAPAGSTGKCKDGTYTTAKTQRGACSRHGGVGQWTGAASAAAPAAAAAATPAAAAPSSSAPANATGKCKDGTFTTAKTQRGACSRHGGVGEWMGAGAAATAAPAEAPAPASAPASTAAPAGGPSDATAMCNDGTYSHAQHRRGACSRHKGVKQWLKPVQG